MLHRNLSLKATAFCIALGLWFWVLMTEHNPVITRELTTSVRVQDIDSNLFLESKLDPVQVTLRCSRQDWPEASKRIEAYVSARGLGPAKHVVPVKVQAPDGVTVVSVAPASQTVSLERLVSQMRPVEMELQGRLPDGTEFSRADPTPGRVQVSGPYSRVRQVARVVAALDLGRCVPEIPIAVPLTAVDSAGARVDSVTLTPQQVAVRVGSQHETASRIVPVVVRTTGELPAGYRIVSITINPPLVAVTGGASLRDLQYLPTTDFPLDSLTADTTRRLPLVVPDGAKLLTDTIVSVSVKVTKELPVAPAQPGGGSGK